MINTESKKYLKELGLGLKELLFPRVLLCPVCGREESRRKSLGDHCLRQISFIMPPVCGKCGRPNRGVTANERYCRQCREIPYYFARAGAVALYEGLLRECLADLKYRFRPELGAALGVLLVEWVKLHREFLGSDLIVPIPIHRRKLETRGYNQAELLARPLQKYLGIQIKGEIMVRDKMTESQSGLGKTERFANLREAFRVVDAKPLAGKKVLLVDDILTTGATASEASRILLRAGAVTVNVLTLSAGVMDEQWAVTM